MATAHEPVRLQYWPPSHTVDAPDTWPDAYEFGSVEDAVAFAMTQAPANRELAWLRTDDGAILKPAQIRRLWELRRDS
ncbi:hypothetical protein MWN33_00120 [Starkeya koreensis]|uniref:Uncharacterized protein n=1 Tax=Ancylobacter koreensis TaxID=266121 RepID=A0ABT0DGV3_9HYPH|nr:hypothetical protein [Ancylobacter koreensis]MCK0206434.1 hypothetical protein [Ancylobacter koreensis]